MFRDLEDGYHEHAMQFMQRFGPLTWRVTTGRRGEEGWVDLCDFWDKHARFVGVAKLWESRFDEESLKEAAFQKGNSLQTGHKHPLPLLINNRLSAQRLVERSYTLPCWLHEIENLSS